MSNSYYEKGANHYDHHKELHIDTMNGGDIEKLISAFFKDESEDKDEEYAEYEEVSGKEMDCKPLENKILKKNHNGKPIDFLALHKRIETSFVAEIRYGYEWLSLWRMLFDLKLLEDTPLTAYAEQMNKWYPNAKKPCCADSMGDYYNPYLGVTAFVQWNEEEFKKRKTSKQSISGYRRLYNDCETIKEALKSLFK